MCYELVWEIYTEIFVSFCCMICALGAKYPVSILLALLAKGCWVFFMGAFLEQG